MICIIVILITGSLYKIAETSQKISEMNVKVTNYLLPQFDFAMACHAMVNHFLENACSAMIYLTSVEFTKQTC